MTRTLRHCSGIGRRLVYSQRTRQRISSPEGIEDPAIAAAFNRIARWPQIRLLRWYVVRRALGMTRHGEAIDLGCGPSYLVVEAERFAAHAGLGDRVAFRKGNVQRIPFPDASLDLVVSAFSLHPWSDPVPVLDEVARGAPGRVISDL